MMKMKALDQVHISSVSPNTIAKGAEFEVSAALGKELEKKGLATRVGPEQADETQQTAKAATESKDEASREAAAATTANKAEQLPLSKAGSRKRG